VTGGSGDDEPAAPQPPALADPVRRRLDEIFGDVLPDVTRDEQREAADEPPPAAGDEWLRANRPPHHAG
jgi:hypothetical protein